MVCCDLVSWSIALLALYFVVSKFISLLRIDRYTDVYVLITGCDTGFGNEAARRFDRMGCHVFAGCLTEKAKESLTKECTERLHAISLDVTKEESIREAYEYVKSNIPKGRGLWGVINNAGIFGKMGPLEWFRISDYTEVLDINLYGLINVTMTFLPLIKKARGRVVNTSSTSGRHSFANSTPYCISKHGVEVFTDALRRQLRPWGATAVLVEPGTHKTNLTAAQNVRKAYVAGWESASPAAKEEYGEEFLKEIADATIDQMSKLGSDKILEVVDAYEKGILGRYPRARYLVGFDPWIFMPIQALPEWLGDWLLTSAREGPKPACFK